MGRYKLGRGPATRPAALKDLAVYATGVLPTPPATWDPPGGYSSGAYPMDGNDLYGDCTMAGVAHMIRGWDIAYHQQDPVPTEQQVIDEYFHLTGGVDSGLVEADVLHEWYRSGLFGERIAGYAPVPPHRLLNLHQAVAFYGGCYLGIECPESAQEQFAAKETWTYVEGSPIEGGHCVVALGYGPSGGLHCKTWGGEAVLSAGFLAHFLDEAWAILPHQLVEARKDSLGLDVSALQADLAKV